MAAIDRTHHKMNFILIIVTVENINLTLAPPSAQRFVFCTDDQPYYNKLCEHHQILHKDSENHATAEGVLYKQNTNAYHGV